MNRLVLIIGLVGVAVVGAIVLLLGSVIDDLSPGVGAAGMVAVAVFFTVLVAAGGRGPKPGP
jgi:hypothetical protein